MLAFFKVFRPNVWVFLALAFCYGLYEFALHRFPQDARLLAWGYPYVFEDFRFHMTLTGSIRDEALRERVLGALREHFAAETGPHRFDGVAIFRQRDRTQPFDIVQRFAFQAPALASA